MRRIFGIHPVTLFALLACLLLFMMLVYPAEGVRAALKGISIWWDILFPALFPFFVISELMLGFGIVHFFGTLLDPLMRPVFRVPGIGGFVMAMGFASGYPVGSRLTAQLWDERMVNREEGERLVSFTTTSDPIFLIGAVAVGFFHDVSLAVILAAAHYGTAVLVGVIMRFHGKGRCSPTPGNKEGGSLLLRSFQAMHEARLRDGRPIGTMLGQAIRSSFQLIFVIGGLVVFFSVVLEMLSIGRILNLVDASFGGILQLFGFPAPLSEAIVNGMFEVTLGAKAAGGAAAGIPLVYKAAVGAFVLSWAGLSVHAQVISLLHSTDIRYTPFLFARLLHGVLSAAAVVLLWEPLQPLRATAGRAMAAFSPVPGAGLPRDLWQWAMPLSLSALIIWTLLLVVLAVFTSFLHKNE